MQGYYDYGPQVDLPRPTVVIGYLSDFTRGAVYRAAAMLGLPYHDVDRAVEHESGMEIARLVVTDGEQAYREVESEILRRSLEQQPAGLIALGDGGLLDPRNLERIRELGRLVHLDFEIGNLLWRIRQHGQQPERGPWHPIYREVPASIADLRPFYQARRSGFDQADERIGADSLSVAGASEVLRRLITT